MDASTKKIEGAESRKQDSAGERRRLSRVRHDDRGNAYVEWVDAPAELIKRPKLEIQREHRGVAAGSAAELPAIRTRTAPAPPAKSSGNTTRTDLRKLSEWIKMMRELEERKRDGGPEE